MKFIRKHIPLLIVILVPLMIEQKSLYSFANRVWVHPIAQHISDSIWISILIIAIVSYFYYEGFYHKKSKIILPALLAVIIIMVRTWSYWDFRGCYFTMPFLLLVIYIVAETFPKKKSDTKEGPPDELKREGFAQSIVADIKEKQNLEHSYNYGLVGEWGSGKSFLMEMMYEKMKNEPKTFITYYFKPWEAPNEKEFAIQILNGIKSNSENYELETKINKFLSKIETDSGDILTKTFTTFFSWLISDDSSIDDIKKDLSNYLKKNDKRLVVFLDDLDRLDQSEIKELLRLMRNTFDIPYLFFIVGYDRSYICKTLGFKEFEFDNYISKFFQVRTNVPLPNKEEMFAKYYNKEISQVLNIDPIGFKDTFKALMPNTFLDHISTPRDFENIIASFELSYRNLKENCDWFTLFQLEILRHKEYELYSKIRSDRSLLDLDRNSLIPNGFTDNQYTLISNIVSLNKFGNYKIQNIKYHHKYFSMVNDVFEIDQNELDLILSQNNLLNVERIFDSWLNNGKYEDLDKKLIYYFSKFESFIDPDLLLLIDSKMASGKYSRHSVYIPVIKYLLRILNQSGLENVYYIDEIYNKLKRDQDYRNILYYMVDHNFGEQRCIEIITKFSSLITKNQYRDNQIFYFLQNMQIWLPNLIDKDIYGESFISYKSFNHSFKEKVNPILTAFARTNIVEFLQNFTMSNMVKSSDHVYLIFDNLVPNLLGYDEVLNLLSSKKQSETVLELSDFIENLKESSIDTNGNSIVVVRNFTFSHNEKIVDKS